MNESAFEAVENYSKILKLDFGSAGFARLAQELDFSSEAVNAVAEVFRRLSERKTETTIITPAIKHCHRGHWDHQVLDRVRESGD